MVSGHAIIVCTLEKIELNQENIYEWYLTNFRHIKPFKVKGKLGLYNIDDGLIQYVEENKAINLYNQLAHKSKN